MYSFNKTALLVAAAMMPLHGGTILSAQEQDEGKIIQIGPDATEEQPLRRGLGRLRQPGFRDAPLREGQIVALSRYWIGIAGGPVSAELRSHLDLPDSEGVLVRDVVPDSPAQEGGVEQYDVVTRVNGKPIASVAEIAEQVGEQGERQGKLTLDLIRKGQPRTVWVTPAERPAQPQVDVPPRWGPRRGGWEGLLEEGLGGALGGPVVPGGVSVSIANSGDGPARITVSRDGQTWEITGDDPEALAALPEDLRPMVERLLRQQQQPLDGFGLGRGGGLQDRLQEMEQQVEALRRRFLDPDAAPVPLIEPEALLDEAPPFEQAEPSEVEIPTDVQ